MARARGHTPDLMRLVAGQIWRRARRRLRSGPGYRWRYTGRTPERVLIAPPDLRHADPQIAYEIYHGRFPLAGVSVETAGDSPFEMQTGNRAWSESLHGFGWLRHMHAAGTDLAAANARALVSDWIRSHGKRIRGLAWDPAITARRVMSWLQHSAVVLHGAEYAFYRQFLKSLAVQIRYLRTAVPEMADGEGKLRARIALAFAALSLPAPLSALRNATRNLSLELDRQILPDGGHVSRNPHALLELLADLLPLRQTYANQAEALPPALIGAVERMQPALRFFRHRDGGLAHFNGMGVTIPDRVAAILRHDDTGGEPLLHAPHSGYERLTLGATTVIADTGPPPAPDLSHAAHAGCLSFELSSTQRQFIVNCGIDSFSADDFRPLARATAAHSTATIDDTSQARFNFSPGMNGFLGTPLVAGPRNVSCRRSDSPGIQAFSASHDGYLRTYGIVHERKMELSSDGNLLEGTDSFIKSGRSASSGAANKVAVRFHLHPDVELYHDPDGRLVLVADSPDQWIFSCDAVAPTVEESIFFAGVGGPRKSRQMALHFEATEIAQIEWRFMRTRRG